MKLIKIYLIPLFVFALNISQAQIGGYGTYKFLNLSPTARITAMGDQIVSIYDEDVNMALQNPALLNDKMIKNISLSHKFHFAGISSGYTAYGFKIKNWNLHSGVQYTSYGENDMTDLYGEKVGKVSGADYAFVLGTSKNIYERLNVGINAKFIFSNLGSYNSRGISFDLASVYFIPEKNITIGFVIRNLGTQLTSYGDEKEYTQRNVLVGLTKKLNHLPFRFTVTGHHINRWNLLYDDPNGENNILIIGEAKEKSAISEFSDNLFRHINFSGEFMLGKNGGPFRLRFGYNYMKAKEMTVYPFRSFAGFSMGIGLRIKKIRFDYAYSIQHLIGGKSHITISTNLNNWGKKL